MLDFVEIRKTVLISHNIVNIVLSSLYFVSKTVSPVCDVLFWNCELELKEWEWLTFLACVIVLKNRRKASFTEYFGTACLFGKLLNGFMFFKQSAAYGIAYGILWLLQFIFVPYPAYDGPEYITYFKEPNLEEEIEKDKRVTWFIEFYAAWSPACVNFSSTFSELSAEYQLKNFKFGKIDISKHTALAEKFRIDVSSWSRQLPTLILFVDGKEELRKPFRSHKGTVVRYVFSKENIINDFNLNELYRKCKQNPIPTKKEKKKKEE